MTTLDSIVNDSDRCV